MNNKAVIAKLNNYRNETRNNPAEEEQLNFKRSGKNGIIRNKKDREHLKLFNLAITALFFFIILFVLK